MGQHESNIKKRWQTRKGRHKHEEQKNKSNARNKTKTNNEKKQSTFFRSAPRRPSPQHAPIHDCQILCHCEQKHIIIHASTKWLRSTFLLPPLAKDTAGSSKIRLSAHSDVAVILQKMIFMIFHACSIITSSIAVKSKFTDTFSVPRRPGTIFLSRPEHLSLPN